tara:strand:+ start:3431 stop:4147 length:717 start_codon:yes stop_codon:yes gene_type:complete
MGSRPSRPTIEVPKPVAYRTVVPEADFRAADEYLNRLSSEEDKYINLEYKTLGNPEKQAYDDRVDRMFELGSYNASLPSDDPRANFSIDPKIRKGLFGAFEDSRRDVNRARKKFEKTPQGGGKPNKDKDKDKGSGRKRNLSDYMRFLANYDHKKRGAGSQKGTARFSGLDVRFVTDAAKKYNITDKERNKAIIDATKGYKEEGVRMGGKTAAQLEKLKKGGSKHVEAKKKAEDRKKQG